MPFKRLLKVCFQHINSKLFSQFISRSKSIDINIHPTKTEVKFDDEPTMYALLRAAVKHSLGQFSIAPILIFSMILQWIRPIINTMSKSLVQK